MPFVPTMSVIEMERTSDEIIENGAISEPELPAEILVDRLIEASDKRFIAELGRSMIAGAWAKKVRAWRAANAETRERARPKGFEHLPLRIRIYGDKSVSLVKAHYSHMREFCKLRSKQHEGRKKDDPVLREARKLRDRLKRRSKRRRGITAGEVLGFDW